MNSIGSARSITDIVIVSSENAVTTLPSVTVGKIFAFNWPEKSFGGTIKSEDKLVVASLAEGPGAFIQAVINYRKKIKKKINNDKLFGVTIHPEGNYIEMGKQFMSYYKKNHPDHQAKDFARCYLLVYS